MLEKGVDEGRRKGRREAVRLTQQVTGVTRRSGGLKTEPSRGQGPALPALVGGGQTVLRPGCFPQARACLSRSVSHVSWQRLSDAGLLAPVKV